MATSAPPKDQDRIFIFLRSKNFPAPKKFRLAPNNVFKQLTKFVNFPCKLMHNGVELNLDATPNDLGMKRGTEFAVDIDAVPIEDGDAPQAATAVSAPPPAADAEGPSPDQQDRAPRPKWAAPPGKAPVGPPPSAPPPPPAAVAPAPSSQPSPMLGDANGFASASVIMEPQSPERRAPAPAAGPNTAAVAQHPPSRLPTGQAFVQGAEDKRPSNARTSNVVAQPIATVGPAASLPASALAGPGRVAHSRHSTPRENSELRTQLAPGNPSLALNRHSPSRAPPVAATSARRPEPGSIHVAAHTSTAIHAHHHAHGPGAAVAAPAPVAASPAPAPPQQQSLFEMSAMQLQPNQHHLHQHQTAVQWAPTPAPQSHFYGTRGQVGPIQQPPNPQGASFAYPGYFHPAAPHAMVVPAAPAGSSYFSGQVPQFAPAVERAPSPPPPPPPPPQPSVPLDEFLALRRETTRLRDAMDSLRDELVEERAQREVLENQVRQLAAVVLSQMEQQQAAASDDFASREHHRQMTALKEQRRHGSQPRTE